MEKLELIKCITDTIKNYGSFSIGEVEEGDLSVAVGSLGGIVGLAEYFTQYYCKVNVYDPSNFSSDAIDTYEEKYEALSEDVLSEVLFVCEQWKAECIRTQKRISN